jgi:hypothetical protein
MSFADLASAPLSRLGAKAAKSSSSTCSTNCHAQKKDRECSVRACSSPLRTMEQCP